MPYPNRRSPRAANDSSFTSAPVTILDPIVLTDYLRQRELVRQEMTKFRAELGELRQQLIYAQETIDRGLGQRQANFANLNGGHLRIAHIFRRQMSGLLLGTIIAALFLVFAILIAFHATPSSLAKLFFDVC
ncbi:hypothetical protein SUNI508_02447 [Seiridium unicorne]|uniref:Uncharacterized protein n=1 Tax=Seiridium unicorne TaxID=138068 RepID=A0ABR2UFI1_9PEZI